MTKVPHPLWIELPDGNLTAVGHNAGRVQAGHVILDPSSGRYSQLVTGRHGRLEYWAIAPENLHRFGLLVRPATS